MATDDSAALNRPRARSGGDGPTRPQAPAPARTAGGGLGPRVSKYLGEVRTELKKTSWPTRGELKSQTQVVIGMLVIVGVFIAAWDFVLGQVFRLLETMMGVRH
jgi:preprotein translocase SecE subunit